LTGYVQWNDDWWESSCGANSLKFSEKFLNNLRCNKWDTIHLYTKLATIKNDSIEVIFKASTKKDYLKILLREVRSIIELKILDSDRYESAGYIPIFSQKTIELLRTNPMHVELIRDSASDVYFLSYNKEVSKEYLKRFSLTYGNVGFRPDSRIIIVHLSYD
jgi:hypothetical protein